MKTFEARILSNRNVAQGIFEIELHCPEAEAPAPGQFVNVRIPDAPHLLLSRPISVNSYADGVLTLVYQLHGEGTQRLSRAKQGEVLSLLGPLGKGFTVPTGKRITLVGGGIGAAPLRYIAECFPANTYKAVLGFRNAGLIYQEEIFRSLAEVTYVTEDGSLGEKGYVTQVLGADTDLILACGPTPMLRAVQRFALDNGIEAQLSLEERMGCGIGACLVCACKVSTADGQGVKRVCADGPVFDAKEVLL